MTDQKRQARIAALLRERAGYVAKGDAARVKAVDESLAAFGHSAAAPVRRATKRSD